MKGLITELNNELTLKISELFLFSDNGPTHFKNKDQMFFLQEKIKEHLFLVRVSWGFGAPGHGKGPWDGIGLFIYLYTYFIL